MTQESTPSDSVSDSAVDLEAAKLKAVHEILACPFKDPRLTELALGFGHVPPVTPEATDALMALPPSWVARGAKCKVGGMVLVKSQWRGDKGRTRPRLLEHLCGNDAIADRDPILRIMGPPFMHGRDGWRVNVTDDKSQGHNLLRATVLVKDLRRVRP